MHHWKFARYLLLLAALIPLLALMPERAVAQKDCLVLCTPKVVAQPGISVSNTFDQAEVRMLPDGTVTEVPSETHFVMVVSANIPTTIPRTTLYAQILWTPWAGTQENPFTGYTADEVGEEEIRDNPISYETGAMFSIVKPKQLGGWLGLNAAIADQISPAAEPDDAATYTHKLQLSGTANWGVFNWLPKSNWLHHVEGYTTLDYVATGLPDEGDEVPQGARVFLEDASPWTFYAGLSVPIAPLDPGN